MPAVTLPPGLQHQRASVNGISMHYAEAGSGDDVILFLHGFPESWYSWRHQIAHFADRYRVIAPDQRGYNLTEAAKPYDAATLQADVIALIDRLGVERVHLVAHDWGAMVAWWLAMNHPERLRSLAICNVPHPAVFAKQIRRSPRQWARSWYMAFFQLPWLPEKALAAQRYHRLARMLINDTRPGTFTRDDVKEILAAWRRKGLGGGLNWYRSALRDAKLPDPVPLILTPTVLIWGEDDVALGKELTYGTDDYVKDLAVHYLPNTSHWVQQEEPAAVNHILDDHFARVEARDSA